MPTINDNTVLLESAERTETTTSRDVTNTGARGLHLIIDVTAVTDTPTITVTLQGKDEVSGKYYTLLTSAGISTVSTTVLRLYPGLTASANVIANDVLPPVFRLSVAHSDTDAITYSIGANLVI